MNCVVCGQPTRSSAAEPTCSIKCFKIKNRLCGINGCSNPQGKSADLCSNHEGKYVVVECAAPNVTSHVLKIPFIAWLTIRIQI
jgi:hypothetical protein